MVNGYFWGERMYRITATAGRSWLFVPIVDAFVMSYFIVRGGEGRRVR